jgi:hypothetical protein
MEAVDLVISDELAEAKPDRMAADSAEYIAVHAGEQVLSRSEAFQRSIA